MKFPVLVQRALKICDIKWESIGDVEDCSPFAMTIGFQNRTIQVSGILAGATVALLGSNDAENWHTLRDPQGNKLLFTTPDLKSIQELPAYIKPVSTGGVDSEVTVSLFLQGNN